MQIQQYVQLLREGWWIILATALISTGAGTAYSYSKETIYESSASFVVNPATRIAETYDLLYSIDTLAGRSGVATTYSNILDSRVIIQAAAASLGLPPESITPYEINTVVLPDSSVLMLRIQGPSPVLAADLANAIGTVSIEYISKLQAIYELRRLDLAVLHPDPISPDHPVDIALAGIVGLAGGIGFLFLRYFLAQLLVIPSPSVLPQHELLEAPSRI
ncbi:MAG: Wzz/FepE/Etk N-terminal domain-containing protein [Anaerolineae bacterium]